MSHWKEMRGYPQAEVTAVLLLHRQHATSAAGTDRYVVTASGASTSINKHAEGTKSALLFVSTSLTLWSYSQSPTLNLTLQFVFGESMTDTADSYRYW